MTARRPRSLRPTRSTWTAALACALVLICATATPGAAQWPPPLLLRSGDVGPYEPLPADRGAAAVWQRLQKLQTTGSVLYTSGHPDDEEAGVLTLLSRGMGVRTSLLTLNRGEGGANAIGPELFDALGLIRSEELRLAGRYYGLDDQYYTTAVDYGYSKTLDEAMRSWGREAVLADLVRIIRINRPLVVISRWHGSARDGHGHHQATGVLTPEAVEAAADPTRFPDQIAGGLRPWRVLEVYRGRLQDGERADVELDPHQTSPWLGRSYQEFGAYGLSLQRSQTAGRVRSGRGRAPARYERLTPPGSDREAGLFDGIDTSLSGIFELVGEPAPDGVMAHLRASEAGVAAAVEAFSMEDPWAVAPHLAEARAHLLRAFMATPADGDASFLMGVELNEMALALEAALGLELEATAVPHGEPATTPLGVAVPGQELDVHVRLTVGGPEQIEIVHTRADGAIGVFAGVGPYGPVAGGATLEQVVRVRGSDLGMHYGPWFYRESIAQNLYSVRDSAHIHVDDWHVPLNLTVAYRYGGQDSYLRRRVRVVEPQPPYGTARYPLVMTPALSVRATPETVVLTPEASTATVTVEVRSHAPGGSTAEVELELPSGWTAEPATRPVSFTGPDEIVTVAFEVETGGSRATGTAQAVARSGGDLFRQGYERIVHRDLPPMYLYRDATVRIVPVAVEIAPGLEVGYVMGVGDQVPDAISQLGARVSLLDGEALATGELGAYDAIVIGTRAYAVRTDLVASNDRLLDYARNGGNLVVLYQTPEYDPGSQAPYPATLPGNAEEVSEEDAPVTILAPDHPLLTSPNRIEASDFGGWIEQRGSKFFATWSDAYTPLIETHDSGQAPQEGVWLSAPIGDGHFTYASIALHRQLPYGVPGAYRILANLLSLGASPR